ncbi:MAG: hypothetical protein IJK63_00545 [Oscillospiraceae bacterium]|nr:hypothetical protein [Oscillospiraceae bacterium]
MKYDLSRVMLRAWSLYRKTEGLSFGEALHRAWISEKARPINEIRIAEAKEAAGITEQTETWAGWKALGYEVVHGARAVFAVSLIHGSRGDGKSYRASFFTRSQVQAVA